MLWYALHVLRKTKFTHVRLAKCRKQNPIFRKEASIAGRRNVIVAAKVAKYALVASNTFLTSGCFRLIHGNVVRAINRKRKSSVVYANQVYLSPLLQEVKSAQTVFCPLAAQSAAYAEPAVKRKTCAPLIETKTNVLHAANESPVGAARHATKQSELRISHLRISGAEVTKYASLVKLSDTRFAI